MRSTCHKCASLSLNLRWIPRRGWVQQHTYVITTLLRARWEAEEEFPEVHGLASLCSSEQQQKTDPSSSKVVGEDQHPRLFFDLHTCVVTHTHSHNRCTRVCTHTCHTYIDTHTYTTGAHMCMHIYLSRTHRHTYSHKQVFTCVSHITHTHKHTHTTKVKTQN